MNSDQVTKKPLYSWVAAALREAGWAPLSLLGVYLLARSLQLFKWFPLLDIPTHFLGGVAITYFFRVAIRHSQKVVGEIPFAVQVLFAITCTGTAAIFWEFYENLLDFFFDTGMVRGVQDTVVDLLMGLLGALALTLVYRRRQ
jgi:hypothetical protein